MNQNSSQQFIGILVLAFVATVFFNFFEIRIAADKAAEGAASLVLEFDSAKKRVFQGPVVEGMTALEAISGSSIGGGFEINYRVDDNGDVYLTAIDGNANNGVNQWHFYLNGRLIQAKNIGRTVIKKHDLIEARFE